MNDETTPVLIGCGQITQREADPQAALAPLDLMAQAARLAAEDSGAGRAVLAQLDSLAVIRLFADTSPRFTCPFGRYANPPRSLAQRLGATQLRQLVYTHPGGNMPQYCLNRLAEAITRGEIGSALVVGAESLATQKAAQRAGLRLDWNEDPGGDFESWGVATRGWSDVEQRHGLKAAIVAYPLIENAIRAALGRTLPEHQQAMGVLLARFAAVAAANPLADRRAGYSAQQIAHAGPGNPVIASPYTRLMSANAFIDQGAALIMTSVAQAKRLGVPPQHWVYLHGCADAHDHWYLSERREFHTSPAMRMVFGQALQMAGVSLAEIGAFDLYSCFASAVEVACESLGLAQDDPRGLTVTGGLPYFGGPGNNYVSHAIAAMMDSLRAAPGTYGLVTANGNYLTKHSAGVYSTRPPERAFARPDQAATQAGLDQAPRPRFNDLADGPARIATWTVVHDAKGATSAIVLGQTDDGARFIANTPADVGLLAEMQDVDQISRKGRVQNDGVQNTFVPS